MESGATRCESFFIPVSKTIEQSADWIWKWVVDQILMRELVFLLDVSMWQRSFLAMLAVWLHERQCQSVATVGPSL